MSRGVVAWLVFVVLVPAASRSLADDRTFPYEGIITEDTLVHSGPGQKKYYPTGRLKAGDRVTVQRRDPGGWYMILPPPGSFSWVPAKMIERNGQIGTAIANNVTVRVGRLDGDRHSVEQRRLSTGDEVRILGEKVLASSPAGSSETWYKIEPPAREWRWVMGRHVAAAGEAPKAAAGRSPSRERAVQPTPAEKPIQHSPASLQTPEPEPEPDQRPSPEEDQDQDQNVIAALDAEFQRVLDLDKTQWNFSALDAGYRQVRQSARNPGTQRLVDHRLASIRQYSREAGSIQLLSALTEDHHRRDAELAARQAQLEARLYGTRPTMVPQPAASQPPVAGNATDFPRLLAPEPVAQSAVVQKVSRRFDGAGIVQPSPAGSPAPFLLMAPDGRVLAFLVPEPGVDLSGWAGKSAGVHGARSHRAEFHADQIQVTGLEPVRLQ